MKNVKFVDDQFEGLDGILYDGQMKYRISEEEMKWIPVLFIPTKRRNEAGNWEEYTEPFDPGDMAACISAAVIYEANVPAEIRKLEKETAGLHGKKLEQYALCAGYEFCELGTGKRAYITSGQICRKKNIVRWGYKYPEILCIGYSNRGVNKYSVYRAFIKEIITEFEN